MGARDLAIPINSQPPDPEPELIRGLLHKQGKLLISGETDSGKSLVGLEICHALVTGRPLWGHLDVVERLDSVLYILAEHSSDQLLGLWQSTGLGPTLVNPESFWFIGPEKLPNRTLVIRGHKQQDLIYTLQSCVKELGVQAIVFDPVTAFFTGEGSENDSPSVRATIEAIEAICLPTRASAILLGHTGKPFMDKDGNLKRRLTYATRGAAGFEDATEVFYLFKQDEVGTRFQMHRRKYKGKADHYNLVRGEDPNRRHRTEMDLKAEVKREGLARDYERFKKQFPDQPDTEILKMVATAHDMHLRTVQKWLFEEVE